MTGSRDQAVMVVGHACVDLLPRMWGPPGLDPGVLTDIGPLEIRCGGSVVNTAEALRALGRRVRVAASIGDDHLGVLLERHLRDMDPDAFIERVDEGTSYSLVFEHGGASRAIWHHVGANARFDGRRLDLRGFELVHLGYATALPGLIPAEGEGVPPLLEAMAAAGATRSVDFATVDPSSPERRAWRERLARLLPHMDVVSPSADDLASIGWLDPGAEPRDVADAARRLVSGGAAVALVTDGARGAHLHTADRVRLASGGAALKRLGAEWEEVREEFPAAPVAHVVGTNGAGDTATAGLIHALLAGYTPRDAGRLAVAVAARRVAGLDLRIEDA